MSWSAAPSDPSEPPPKRPRIATLLGFCGPARQKHAPLYWPRDLLPDTLPTARIMTYGYDTRLSHPFQGRGPAPKSSVYNMAWNFLLQLEAERHADPSRPLLFVAHSLGGILVKEALRRSERCKSSLRDVFTSTTALMFFGTPHGGADPRGALHKLIERAIRGMCVSVNDSVLDTLLGKSDRLEELRNEFNPIAQEQNWPVHSFQEELGVKLLFNRKVSMLCPFILINDSSLTDALQQVVIDAASCLHIDSETKQYITRNHMDMCRFSGYDDAEYKKVVYAIQCLTAHSLARRSNTPETVSLGLADSQATLSNYPAKHQFTKEETNALIEKLRFPHMDSRQMGVRRAHIKTCTWLLDSAQYRDWLDDKKLDEHRGFLWMKGKPGTGKSTIMKFAYHEFRESRLGNETVILSFFFHARGTELEKSTQGMYRALLVQLLESIPHLASVFALVGLRSSHIRSESFWTLELLEQLFAKAVESLGTLSVVCFIDALDECEEVQARKMVRSLEQIVATANLSGTKFRVFLSSRYYPQVTMGVGLELLLDRQEGHHRDIEAFVESELRIGSGAHVAKIRNDLEKKSQGVFMWVVLVTDILSAEFDRGRAPRQLQQKLMDMPYDLHQLFRDILMRDSGNQDDFILCMQCLLFAREPFDPEQLYSTMQMARSDDLAGGLEEISSETIEKYIRNVSKGMAEVTRSESPTVQFIHESVRDFLIKGNGLRELWPELTENFEGEGHDRLKQCCYRVLMFDLLNSPLREKVRDSVDAANSLRDQARRRYSLLGYAVRNILQHTEAAESGNVDQSVFMESFPLRRWTFYHYVFDGARASRYSPKTSLLYVLAELGLTTLITKYTNPQKCLVMEGGNYLTPLFAALVAGSKHESTVKVLLEALPTHGCPSGSSASWYEYWKSQGRLGFRAEEDNRSPPALLIAATPLQSTGNDILFEYDPQLGTVDDFVEGGSRGLVRAVHMGRADLVRLLIEGGSHVNIRTQSGATPLCVAAAMGHANIVSILLENGVDTKATDSQGLTPLISATRGGHATVVSLLLDYKCAKESSTHRPAAEGGHDDEVTLLLDRLRSRCS
ncbi:unnamed protein product [Sordaria macrospora k-hell]|uniref:WGS project CABT00000000 data, contig 2.55 n=1 Tax=Sordaria macrospora (strain ATCC MYA-333 / DSM 997 / K(L3346) / K-hell) TaxID=771870 RepID=F7W9U8_SORMK|nr:uncharacterized protein SMAC_08707 [Sordaria macrospora k-hell]CCC05215.1 unnamed protein product [Sordaria macrospora k-hell]